MDGALVIDASRRRQLVIEVSAILGPDPDIAAIVDSSIAVYPDAEPDAIAEAVLVARGDAIPFAIESACCCSTMLHSQLPQSVAGWLS